MATSGDDVLTGGLGDDLIDGGSDIDAAVYTDVRLDHSVTISHGQYVISDLRADGTDSTDRIGNIELFAFSDGIYSIADLLDTQAAGAPGIRSMWAHCSDQNAARGQKPVRRSRFTQCRRREIPATACR